MTPVFYCSEVMLLFSHPGLVRLANSTQTNTTYSGRVEVFINGEWGTVCSDHWNFSSACILCRELGYPIVEDFYTWPSQYDGFYARKGKIWLSKVQCESRAHSIFECQQSGFGNNDCSHSQDLGITCSISAPGTNTCTHGVMHVLCEVDILSDKWKPFMLKFYNIIIMLSSTVTVEPY